MLTFKIILCPLQTFLVLFSEYNAFKSAVMLDIDFIMTKANIKKLKPQLDFYAKINFQNLLPNFLHNLILPLLFRTQHCKRVQHNCSVELTYMTLDRLYTVT